MTDVAEKDIIKLRLVRNPFDPSAFIEEELVYDADKTLDDYMEGLPNPEAWTVGYNGLAIKPSLWKGFSPQPGEMISLVRAPEGGGDAKQILRLAALIAVAVLAPQFAGLSAWAWGLSGTAAQILTGAYLLGGALVVNALLPPPTPDLPTADFDARESPSFGIDGAKNTARQGLPVPVVYGKFRVAGNITDIFTENRNDTQYLFMRTSLNDGEVNAITDIEVNEQPVDNFNDVEVRTRLGAETQTANNWFEESVRLINRGSKMSTSYVTHTTTGDVDKLRLDFVAPQGIVEFDEKGDKQQRTVDLEIQFRAQGTTTWNQLPLQSQTFYGSSGIISGSGFGTSRTRVFVRPDENDLEPGGMYYSQQSQIRYRPAGGGSWTTVSPQNTTGRGLVSPTWGFGNNTVVAPGGTHTYDLDLADGDWEIDVTTGTLVETETRFTAGTTLYTMRGATTRAQRKTLESIDLPRDTYEVRVRRSTVESSDTQIIDSVYLSDIGEIDNSPVQMNGVANLGLRIKVTDQINNRPNVTALVEGCLLQEYDRDGTPTVRRYSANPAWIVLDMLTNPLRGGAMSLSRIDMNMFVEWAEHCDVEGYEFNGVFDYETNLWDASQLVCRVGHAQFVRMGTKWSVAIDRADTPMMIFNDTNIIKDTFSTTWLSMNERANEIQLSYADEDDGYKRKTIRLVDDTVATPGERSRVSAYSEMGITNIDQAAAEAEYQLRRNKLLQKTVTFDAPIEGIAITLGDVAEIHTYQGDFAGGMSGKTAAGSTTTNIQLDRDVTIAGGTYALLMYIDAVQLHSASISSISGNEVAISGLSASGNYDDVARLIQGGDDVAVLHYYNNGGTLTLVVDDASVLSTGACQLWDTQSVEERTITTGAGTHSSVTVNSAFSKAPSQYTNWIFGEVANVSQQFRCIGIDGDGLETRQLTFIEYDDALYAAPGVAIPAPEIVGPDIPEHVRDLSIDYSKAPTGDNEVQNLIVSWNKPDTLEYGGADVYTEINGEWRAVNTVLDVTSSPLEVRDATALKIRVVGFDRFGRRAPFASAPTLDFTADYSFRPLSDITAPSVSDTAYDITGRVNVSWSAPSGEVVTNYRIDTRTLSQVEYDAIVADPTVGEPQAGWTQLQIDAWNNSFTATLVTPDTFALVPNLKQGYYQFRIRAERGQSQSEWVTLLYELAAPTFQNQITGLNTVDAGTTFNGKHAEFVWDDIFAAAIAEGKDDLPYILQDYQVEILSLADAVLRTEYVQEARYLYTYDKNSADTAGARARRSFKIRVTARGRQGQVSLSQTITATNPAPSAAGAPVIAGADVTLPIPNDADFLGYRVWVKETDDIDTAVDTSFDISQNNLTIPGTAGNTYYFIYAPIDEFDDTALNESTSYQVDIPVNGVSDYTQLSNRPVTSGAALPSPTGYVGPELFYNTTDGVLYRYSGGAWTAAVDAVNVDGILADVNIPDIDAAKVATGIFGVDRIPGLDVAKLVSGTMAIARIPDLPASQITSGQFTGVRIADDAITAPKLAADSVEADKIKANAVTVGKIDAGAVTVGTIASNAVIAGTIAANAIVAANIVSGEITTDKLDAGAVTTEKIEAGAVTATEIRAGTITAVQMAADSVTATQILAGSVTTGKLDAGAVTADKLDAGAVTADKIFAGAVTAIKIEAGAITADKMSADFGTFEDYISVGASGSTTDVTILAGNNYNTSYRFWTGSLTPAAAPFSLSKDGKIVARDLEIRNDANEVIFNSTTGFTDVARNNMLLNSGTFVNPATASLSNDTDTYDFTLFGSTDIDYDVVIPALFVADSFTGSIGTNFSPNFSVTVEVRTAGVGSYVSQGSQTLTQGVHYEVVQTVYWAPGGGLGSNGYVSYAIQGLGVYKGPSGEIIVPTIAGTIGPGSGSEDYDVRIDISGVFQVTGGLGSSTATITMANQARTLEMRDTNPGQGFIVSDSGATGGNVTNADTLGGQPGSYYLNRANHTGTINTSDLPEVIELNGGTTYDPSSTGAGTDTATDVGLSLANNTRIVGHTSGYIRTLLSWTASGDIAIGQGGTTIIGGINLLPGASGLAKYRGEEIATRNWVIAQGYGTGGGGGDVTAAGNNTFTGTNTFGNTTSFTGTVVVDQSALLRSRITNGFDFVNTTPGQQNTLEVYQDTSGADAAMTFHIAGDYAVQFGLDGGTNDLAVGGWSMGAVSHRIFHQGNADSLIYGTQNTWTANQIIRSTSPTIYFRDTDHNSAMVHVNSNILYVLRGGTDSTSWVTHDNGRWPMEIGLTAASPYVHFAGVTRANGGFEVYTTDGTFMGQFSSVDTTWLRINQDVAKNIYTPRMFRADGGLQILGANASTAAAPGITFADDTNTGFYWLGADRLGVATGGVKAAEFTTSSNNDLYLGDTSNYLLLQRTSSGNGVISLSGANTMQFYTNGVRRTFINATGINMDAGYIFNHNNTASFDKIRVWNSSSYTIGMTTTLTYGGLNGYAMTFSMNNDSTRGWLWRHTSMGNSDGAMSLTTQGVLQVRSTITAAGNITANSDIRLKENLRPFDDAYDILMALQPRRFDWKSEYTDRGSDFGLIAQHTMHYVPEAVETTEQYGISDIKSLNYGKLAVLGIAGIQKHHHEIESLKERVAELEARLAA